MDSVSQIALGASVCYAVIGPKIGKRALLIGAIAGTLPDLDVLVPYDDSIASFTYHRSWSHSLLVLSAVSWPLTWLIRHLSQAISPQRQSPADDVPFARWWFAIWLVLITHPLLDSFTIYGTQIWWPLPLPPVAIGSIFIIDPLYTIPLIASCIGAWRFANGKAQEHAGAQDREQEQEQDREQALEQVPAQNSNHLQAWRFAIGGIVISTGYLIWTLSSQFITTQRIEKQLTELNIEPETIVAAPFPTALLWRIIVVSEEEYLETFSSLLDDKTIPLHLTAFQNNQPECEKKIVDHNWAIKRMDWFTNGSIAVNRSGDRLIISDLRMGIEDDYVFEFDIGGWTGDVFTPSQAKQKPIDFDFARLSSLTNRITDQSIVVSRARTDTKQAGC